MARIFYHTSNGSIYGVHSGSFGDALPNDIDFIDVPEAPDQIPWPVNSSGKSGEEFARVQGGVLVAFDPDFSAIDQVTVDRMLLESGVLRALASTQFLLINEVRMLQGKSAITITKYKDRILGLIR